MNEFSSRVAALGVVVVVVVEPQVVGVEVVVVVGLAYYYTTIILRSIHPPLGEIKLKDLMSRSFSLYNIHPLSRDKT